VAPEQCLALQVVRSSAGACGHGARN
jgi:hypothetical protein